MYMMVHNAVELKKQTESEQWFGNRSQHPFCISTIRVSRLMWTPVTASITSFFSLKLIIRFVKVTLYYFYPDYKISIMKHKMVYSRSTRLSTSLPFFQRSRSFTVKLHFTHFSHVRQLACDRVHAATDCNCFRSADLHVGGLVGSGFFCQYAEYEQFYSAMTLIFVPLVSP